MVSKVLQCYMTNFSVCTHTATLPSFIFRLSIDPLYSVLHIVNFGSYSITAAIFLRRPYSACLQLTHNMTRDCSLNSPKNTSSEHIVYKNCFFTFVSDIFCCPPHTQRDNKLHNWHVINLQPNFECGYAKILGHYVDRKFKQQVT